MARNNQSSRNQSSRNQSSRNRVTVQHGDLTIEVSGYEPSRESDTTLAAISLNINNAIVVGGIWLRACNGGVNPFLAFPSYKKKDGSYKDLTFPLSRELREDLTAAAVEIYNNF